MAMDSRSSKLAVILHADVVGSTLMVQKDEHLAHERIQDTFRRFGETINNYSGHVLELRGDALLAEFERPSDAVVATLAFQNSQPDYLSTLDDDLKPKLRVGISMGEVVVADSTVTGAGVVIAQRVEQLAEVGGICITSTVQELLPKRLALDFVSLGEQQLKGFDDPVRVFKVTLKSGESLPLPQAKSLPKAHQRKWKPAAFVAFFILSIIAGIGYWGGINDVVDPPGNTSIAILPFENLSGDAEQEYFADGMTDDLITDVSKIPDLLVIARNSVFPLKDTDLSTKQVAEKLGVRYVMEGSVRRAGKQVRINVQLIDSTTEGNVWAERYDGTLDDVFAMQDKITRSIVSELSLTLGIQIDTSVETTVTEAGA